MFGYNVRWWKGRYRGVGAELERKYVLAEVTGAKAKGTEAAEIMEGSNAQVLVEQRREQQCHFNLMNAPT